MDASALGTEQNQIYLLVALFVNLAVQLYREWRDHKWKQAEVARLVTEKEEHKRYMNEKLDEQTKELKQTLNKRVEDLGQHFDDLLPEEADDSARRKKGQ